MRVFILNTGRCGSTAIYHACRHIENFTAGHESLATQFGTARFDYPDNHIESDNRLSWHLGQLDSIFGDDAFYIHLKRNRQDVAASFMKRFGGPVSIIDAFCVGIRMTPLHKLDDSAKLLACYDYIDVVTTNIESFLLNKSKTMNLEIENLAKDFEIFWREIGARGDFHCALKEFELMHNAS